jgi:uncharacterized protein (TIGR02217 family)
MSFIDVQFPPEVSRWAHGGRGFNTTVTETYGGDEYRNAAWSQALGEWDVSEALRTNMPNNAYYFKALRDLFMACSGQLNAFRFKDWTDYTDETAGVFVMIDSTHFQMYKNYVKGGVTYSQIIQKPVASPAVVITGGSLNALDYTTGIAHMNSGTPTSWVGQFDIPVRFATDLQSLGLTSEGALVEWQNLKVREVRNP